MSPCAASALLYSIDISGLHDDKRLVDRANRGDGRALEAIYRAQRDWVTALAYRFTGSRDDALDVLQETFTYFFAKFPGFELTSSLRSFLYPVVKHQSISVIRRRQRVVDLDSYRSGGRGESEVRWKAPSGREGDFYRLVERLPDGQREVVYLRFGLDFRLPEIAAALDIPLGTVKSRLHNALKSLRSEVGDVDARKKEGSQ